MKEGNIFKMALLGLFGFFIILAVLIFAGFIPGLEGDDKDRFLGNTTIWGTIPQRTITSMISDIYSGEKTVSIRYVQKSAETFDRDLIEALASGVGPDVILLPHNLIVRHRDKLYPVPYESISERSFRDRFIEQGEMFLSNEGILALPLTIDPLVLYWNRDLFSSAGISNVPKTWDEFRSIVPLLTKRDQSTGAILRSAISLGDFRNINHAKDIIATLILQAGNPITAKLSQPGEPIVSVLKERYNYNIPPTEAALRFFTEFSNPVKESYTWNRSLPSSRDMFIAGDLAAYIGYASEAPELERKNPHLNFDVALLPQAGSGSRSVTFGNMEGLAILKTTKNIPAAFKSIALLSDGEFVSLLSESLHTPPARRDLLAKRAPDAFSTVFYKSALISLGWLDPAPELTERIFLDLVEDIVSGKTKIGEAVNNASIEIARLLK